LSPAVHASDLPKSGMGLASNALDMLRASQNASGMKPTIADPLEFLKEAHALGAAGGQTPLGIHDSEYCDQVRRFIGERGMYVEASMSLPGDDAAVEKFEQQVLTAKAMGAVLARAVTFPGRRYETFDSADQYAAAARHALEMQQRAEPIARKHKFRLAVENHKDQRISERLQTLKRLGSEWIGICVDFGNNFALCEDPLEVIKAFAQYGWTSHLKDQAIREYNDGFLFADAALGEGFLDLPAMVNVLRAANPQIRFNLEVMTRDPLKVPVFTPKYWATMPDVPATELARTMRTVKTCSSPHPLMHITGLSPQQRVDLELRDVAVSLAYCRDVLNV